MKVIQKATSVEPDVSGLDTLILKMHSMWYKVLMAATLVRFAPGSFAGCHLLSLSLA